MGAGISDLDWGKDETHDYDMWGWKADMDGPFPGGPPQHAWSEFYREGFPSQGRGEYGQFPVNSQNEAYSIGLAAQSDDVLQSFGASLTDPKWLWSETEGYYAVGPKGKLAPRFATVDGGGWGLVKDPDVCTPLNYPNCSLKTFRQKDPFIQQWSAKPFIGTLSVPANWSGDGPELQFQLPGPAPGGQKSMMDRWLDSIDLIVHNYKAGLYDSLKDVNSKDTSNWDPCDQPGILESFFPVVTAIFTAGVMRYLDIQGVLGEPAAGLVTLNVALFGYHVGKYSFVKGDDIFTGENKEVIEALEKDMAKDLLRAGAIASGLTLGPPLADNLNVDNVTAVQVGLGIGTYLLLQNAMEDFLIQQIQMQGVFAFPVFFLFGLFKGIRKFFCHVGNWGQQACFGGEGSAARKEFPDARLWDVASMAIMLTDEALTDTLWTRDSPEAEFILRGMLTGPAMMYAGADPTTEPIGLYASHMVNPIGLIMPIEAGAATLNVGDQVQNLPTNRYEAKVGSWTGADYDTTSWGTLLLHARYGCNNFRVILEGTEEEPDPTMKAVDQRVSQTLKSWMDALITAASNPSNIQKQGEIPGLESGLTPLQPIGMDPLVTCAYYLEDFDPTVTMSPAKQADFYDAIVARSKVAPALTHFSCPAYETGQIMAFTDMYMAMTGSGTDPNTVFLNLSNFANGYTDAGNNSLLFQCGVARVLSAQGWDKKLKSEFQTVLQQWLSLSCKVV